MTLEELIQKYVDEEQVDKMEALFQRLSVTGTTAEKEILAEGYLSMFAQCQYDFACGKFNDPDGIRELQCWIENVRLLDAEFEQFDYCIAHVYDMLSEVSESKSDQLSYSEQAIAHFRKQMAFKREDVELLIQLAKGIIHHCELKEAFVAAEMDEAKALFAEAMRLETQAEHQHSFFGFNGSAIHHFLHASYQLLTMPADGPSYHSMFMDEFKQTIQPLAGHDPVIYYHWTETLFHVLDWLFHAREYSGQQLPGIENELWFEIREVSEHITALESENEFFLSSLGRLFTRIARVEKELSHYQTALAYYLKALQLKGDSWHNPYYAADTLQEMALLLIEQGDSAGGQKYFEQGLQIYEDAQQVVNDFQLSCKHGQYLFEYARLFEDFTNQATLLAAQTRFEEAKIMGKDFYTSPYYGLAKVALRMGNLNKCRDVLRDCGRVFSNEYHTHSFDDLKDDADFDEVQVLLAEIVDELHAGD